ncbi:MAG: TIGR03985 family CRISPR-associated protein [Cyanobacteria bacterium J069]|nr:MAG: TIGR03985 family CRISPR-associated protein [Cyanobacteria bacterium J069]
MPFQPFSYTPTPPVLHWLSGGQLANRFLRAIRLWVLLDRLYGSHRNAKLGGAALPDAALPDVFRYRQLCQVLYAPSHSLVESASAAQLSAHCRGSDCLCQRTASQLIFTVHHRLSMEDWVISAGQICGLDAAGLETCLSQHPFAITHRSLRDDLKYLIRQGWLRLTETKHYQLVPTSQQPLPPRAELVGQSVGQLSPRDSWILLRLLESVAFVQPQLDVIINTLWEDLAAQSSPDQPRMEPARRIFLHLDYILKEEVQERVDGYQTDIEALWRSPDGGVVQFDYWLAKAEQSVPVTVYPVCLHYARRAKYLSAYGLDPQGQVGWHNYRLDRIRSPRIQVLPWGDPAIPADLKTLRHAGQLPTPEAVEAELEKAWGFNFYLPRGLLIMRFQPQFARWYVDDTERHPTFAKIAYRDLPQLIASQIADAEERSALRSLVKQLPKTDVYYHGWIRLGDINVTMRLRDWRPNGEVIAPLAVRHQMQSEAQQEMEWYGRG